ncbi:MAG: TrmH family RNA methyltransferase [Chloroflexota bacterium]
MDSTPLITSLSNPLVKQARGLRQRKIRAETGLFLVEGIHHVGEAHEANWEIEAVLYAPDLLTSDFAHSLIAHLRQHDRRVTAVSNQVMESLADKDNPQGIVAIVRQRASTLDGLRDMNIRRAAALVSPQDPGNVGSILRTLDAVGADALFVLDGGVDIYHPSAVRASMGMLFWKPVVQASFDEFVGWARRSGFTLIGASAHAAADYRAAHPSEPWILVLGSEQKGLSPGQSAACDMMISLPMRGRASSLNLSVAAGVLLYSMTGQK